MNSLLLIFSLFPLVFSDGYTCPGNIKLSPPNDLSQTVFWPSIWNDSMPPVRFDRQQHCLWEVEIPDGMYATAQFYRDAPATVGIWVEYPNGYSLGIDNKDPYPIYFTSPKFFVHLTETAQQGSFSFKVNYFKYPTLTQKTYRLTADDYPQVGRPNGFLTTFTADTAVSLIAFGQSNVSTNIQLLQSALFDGDSIGAPYLGSLRSVLTSGKAVVSTGKSLSLYTFGLDSVLQDNLYMAQDYSNAQLPMFYHGWDCPNGTSDCPMTLLSYSGPAAVATAETDALYIKSIEQFPDLATLTIYEGRFDNEIARLNKTNYANQLPLKVSGFVKQFMSDSDWMTLQITKDADAANWHQAYSGRITNIHSNNFGTESNDQNTDEYIKCVTGDWMYFSFNVTDYDFSGNATLDVLVTRSGMMQFKEQFSTSNPPPEYNLKVYGDAISFKYQLGSTPTSGFKTRLLTTHY